MREPHIQFNIRKPFRKVKEGEMFDSIIAYDSHTFTQWYDGTVTDKRLIRIDLWILVLYFEWWSKPRPIDEKEIGS